MFVSSYLKTLRRVAPICLVVLAGVNIGYFLIHRDAINFGLFVLIQILVMLVAALIFTPIEYFKLSSHRD